MEYPKIHTLWKRDEITKKLIVSDYSKREFGSISWWEVTEKIDGTNIRITYSKDRQNVKFDGRTKDAQIPCALLEVLMKLFPVDLFVKVFPEANYVVLYGEGYGPKIQNGRLYRKDLGFILFDISCNGWWLERANVEILAERLCIPTVPNLGLMGELDIVEFVKRKPLSYINPEYGTMEGVVCRSHPLMLFRDGKPLMWKLKCRDFE
jgi:ATP-dependent RNA circularization protein (DNA/RNA ligase family)